MLNQTNYNRLNLDHFVVGDSVLIKLRNHAKGWEYFGIVEGMDEKHFHILGKPLAWVLAGDLRLQKYSFYKAVIDEVKFYTLEAAEAAREKAENIKYEIKLKELYDRLCNNSLETGVTPFFDIDKLLKYILEKRQLQNPLFQTNG